VRVNELCGKDGRAREKRDRKEIAEQCRSQGEKDIVPGSLHQDDHGRDLIE